MFPWRSIYLDPLPNFKRIFILSLSNYITSVVGSGEALEGFFFFSNWEATNITRAACLCLINIKQLWRTIAYLGSTELWEGVLR